MIDIKKNLQIKSFFRNKNTTYTDTNNATDSDSAYNWDALTIHC